MPQQIDTNTLPDFHSELYKAAYSRINAIAIEGEHHAFEHFLQLAQLLPEHHNQLLFLAKMESRHKKSFQSCGNNLQVTPDTLFARQFFADLHHNFQAAAAAGQVVTCLLIQSLIIECFAIAAYNGYIPVADAFARNITESVVKDEYAHLNFGEEWLKANFTSSKIELKEANKQNLPIIWRMLQDVETDIQTLGIKKESIVEEFMTHYGDALSHIGFSTHDILQMVARGLSPTA
jgi:fatty aldehyde decarbonylase